MESIRHPARILWVSLFVAWGFDFLFWKKAPGISFFLFVVLCLVSGLVLAWQEKRRPAVTSLLLIAPLLFFSAMTFLRLETFTLFIDVMLSLVLLAMLAHTFLGGRWPSYSLADYPLGLLKLAGSMCTQALSALRSARSQAQAARLAQPGKANPRPAGAVFRGIAIALPVVAVLAALLASADPVFGQGLQGLLGFFHLDLVGEYILRGVYIIVLAYLLAGVFMHALTRSQDQTLAGLEKPWMKPFLGFTETSILMASVDLLLAAFVVVQFRYFFGGQANVSLAGFTYAEYARRGFSELVMVAVISLLLILGTSSVSRRETPRQSWFYRGLVIVLVGLVLVILVSALQRLWLYESAYGFTSFRTYTHILIPWLGALLAATAILEALRRPRAFATAALLAGLGFGVTLNLINVDAFIVRQNVQLAAQGKPLDTAYLAYLSGDAVAAMAAEFHNPQLSSEVRGQVGDALACRLRIGKDARQDSHWQSYNLPAQRAKELIASLESELASPTSPPSGLPCGLP